MEKIIIDDPLYGDRVVVGDEEEALKHLQGKHDQKTHGSWAGGKVRESSQVYSSQKIKDQLNSVLGEWVDEQYWLLDPEKKSMEEYPFWYFSSKELPKKAITNPAIFASKTGMIYSKKPLSVDTVANLKLVPFGAKAKAEAVLSLWDRLYGDKPITLGSDDGKRFSVVHRGTQGALPGEYWQVTRFVKGLGATGHTVAPTHVKALDEAFQNGTHVITDPNEFDKLITG
jgi:hypothetical protein